MNNFFWYKSVLHSFSLITVWLCNFFEKDYVSKSCSENVDEIDYRCQIHQHFTTSFFVQKSFAQLSFNYSKAFGENKICTKAVCKMLVKFSFNAIVSKNLVKILFTTENSPNEMSG